MDCGWVFQHDTDPKHSQWIIQMVIGKQTDIQTGLDMCWLEQSDLASAAILKSMTA